MLVRLHVLNFLFQLLKGQGPEGFEEFSIFRAEEMLQETLFFYRLRAVHGCTAIFGGCKPPKMGAIRKPRFSNGDAEKAMDGFFSAFY